MGQKIPLEIFKDALKYKLIKMDDSGKVIDQWMGHHGIWIKFEDSEYQSCRNLLDPVPGFSFCLDFDGHSFKWQTSKAEEIIKVSQQEIEFKTTGSHYKLYIEE